MDVNESKSEGPTPVAIIGMGCFFPHASGLKAYWHLLYHGKDAISEVPATHWSPSDYYDADPGKPDHVYCRRGGFLSPIPFDPTAFGIPPSNLESTDTSQILALMAAKTALDQAGYGDTADYERDRTAVILGVTGTQELVIPLSSRLSWPKWKRALEAAGIGADKTREIMSRLSSEYVPWQENSFPGLLGNVVAGRICNRLDLGGTNCVVDAACASSLSAINLAMMELYTGQARMVVTGGVDTLNDIFMHMCFARTQILSPTGEARPFSRKADGTVLGEGIGILIMKRLADAEADGDRILALVRGIGSSSDGKSQSIYAPRAEGQLKALRKAYHTAGVPPESVGLIEAHGTGTRVGDKMEIQALKMLFDNADGAAHCALGSVKSMIGHTKAAAGAAGLIKTVLALQHKVLPPTLKADEPDPDLRLDDSPLYLNPRTRPWFRTGHSPRRAGVSAFGFGGSNYHLVLEEYDARRADVAWDGSIEIVPLSETSPEKLQDALQAAQSTLRACPPEDLSYLARKHRSAYDAGKPYRLLLVLTREEDTRGPRWNTAAVFDEAAQAFEGNSGAAFWQTRSCFYGSGSRPGRIAFLFPGQGSQYLNMANDLVAWFPEAMETLESASRHYAGELPLTDYIYPRPSSEQTEKEHEAALRHTAVAQPAIGAVSVAMDKILRRFGLAPEATCGHSYGELTALYSAGWIDEETLHALSVLRGRLMADAGGRPGEPNGAMLAVKAPLEALERLIKEEALDVVLANRNSPNQGVLSGDVESIQRAEAACKAHQYRSVRLPVSAAFHSRLVEHARAPFAAALQTIPFHPGPTAVYSNTTGSPYPAAPDAIRSLLGDHLRNPVDFIGEIEALYGDKHRIFVEVGPKTVLTGLVRAILKDRDFHALAMDAGSGKSFGIADLAHVLCRLAALGCAISWDAWESAEDPPPPLKMRIPLTGANYRVPKPEPTAGESSRLRSATRPSGPKLPDAVDPVPDRSGKSALPALSSSANAPVAALQPTPAAAPTHGLHPTSASHTVNQNQSNHPALAALRVVQQGLQSLQALQTQTVEAHQKFLDTQQQASRTLQEMMESSRRFAEAALNGGITPATGAVAAMPGDMASLPALSAAGIPDPAPPTRDIGPPAPTRVAGPPVLPEATMAPMGASPQDRDAIARTLLEVVSELTGYPSEMLMMDMQIEADLGIDSIKRVEILSKMEERLPSLPPMTPDLIAECKTLGQVSAYLSGSSAGATPADLADSPAPDAPGAVGTARPDAANALLEVVSELTGYPAAMLTLDMEVEADLGIDSIKRVEILSALEDRMTDFPAIAPDEMAELKTLAQIAARLQGSGVQPQSAPPAVPRVPAAEPSATTMETVTAALMAVVSDLTGYPAEMLSADMAIETDLGIDSIKRVEILSAMEDRLPTMPALAPDEMAGLKTIGQIAAALAVGNEPPRPERLTEPASTIAPRISADPVPLPTRPPLTRRVLRAVETPRLPAPQLALPGNRRIFITTDKAGLSHALADQLSAKGLHTVQISIDILKHRPALPDAAGLILLCDTLYAGDNSPAQLKDFLADAFELIRHIGPSLQASAADGGALLATISRMDGTFGVEGLHGRHPYQGGMAGFVKTAALEWPHVTCRALDIDAGWLDNPAVAGEVVDELLQATPQGPLEIGLSRGRRVTLDLHPEGPGECPLRPLALENGDVVVISGGARGVTAAAAEALARERALTLILLGRSPAPFTEPDWLAASAGEADLKKAIIRHEFTAAPPTPQAVQEAYRRFAANREIQANLDRIAAAGADVRYISLDVRDAGKVGAVLNDIRLVHGPIKALIHGAGVLRDHLIADKTAEEFHQVFSTKVDGLENLLAATREDPLRYIVLFSSVAARFGNIGQVDYAVANEVLNKAAMAIAEKREDCLVRSINWGPWDGGMVSASLKKVMAEKQVALIPLDMGANALVTELTVDQRNTVEVVIGSELPSVSDYRPAAADASAPVATGEKPEKGLSTAFISELNLDHYPILEHHRLDRKPVVPFALMSEWFGHGALHNHPGLRLAGLDDMRLLKGIVLDGQQRPIRVLAGAARSNGDGIRVNLELRDGMTAGSEVIHSRATAFLTDSLPDPPVFTMPASLLKTDYHRSVSEIYADILFHGKALQAIHRVRTCNANGMLADLGTAPDPVAWIRTPPRNRWIGDPLVMDGAFQMASLWCYEEVGRVSLPSYCATYRQYCRRFPTYPIQAVLEVRDISRHKLVGNFTFLDRDDSVLAAITGYEAVMEERLIQAFKPERHAAAR